MTLTVKFLKTDLIENYPGFPEGKPGWRLGERFEKQAVRFGARVLLEPVESVDLLQSPLFG
jgi:thioredoxin reductase (NADPH)